MRVCSLLCAAVLGFAGSLVAHAGPFPAALDIDALSPNDGLVINGFWLLDINPLRVAWAGDVNADGIDDVIIGAPGAHPGHRINAGKAFVVFGSADAGGDLHLVLLDGTNGFVMDGLAEGDHLGIAVAGAGDLNGDGIDDIIIGANQADPGGRSAAGETYVILGTPGIGSGGSLDLASLNGTNGFVINGVDAPDESGTAVAFAGDVNNDGIDDAIVGGLRYSSGGKAYVVFGRPHVGGAGSFELANLNGKNGFRLENVWPGDAAGFAVSPAGDVNDDGIDDIAIGAFLAWADLQYEIFRAGQTHIVFGASHVGASGVVKLADLDGADGFSINGINQGDWSGYSVSNAGDVNHDGVDDLIIGAYPANPDGRDSAGQSYVVFGHPGVFPCGWVDLGSLDGTNGFEINGINPRDYSGRSVSGAGDINGDGIDDLVIGAYSADPNGTAGAGQTYVVYGAGDLGAGGVLELSSLDGDNGFTINGASESDNSGVSVSCAGDFNHDGVGDIIIAAPNANRNGTLTAPGQVYVVFGRAAGTPVAPVPVSARAACPGDIDGDGDTDIFDFGIVASHFGQSVCRGTDGDFDRDGLVNMDDFGFITLHFGCDGSP